MRTEAGRPGGAQKSGVTTSPVAMDLTALSGAAVDIWSDDQDLWACFAASASNTTLITSGDSPASMTSLKARRIAKGYPIRRVVLDKFPFLIVGTATGTALVHVKVVSETRG